jgi:hypothetical protein
MMMANRPRKVKLDERIVTGQMDRSISEMIEIAHNLDLYDQVTEQTLKHHAEDMILAGKHILKQLNKGSDVVNAEA